MSIIFMNIGAFLLFGLLIMAAMAITLWMLVIISGAAFMIGGFVISSIFHAGQNGFLIGGICAVLILWGMLTYMGNRIDKPNAHK